MTIIACNMNTPIFNYFFKGAVGVLHYKINTLGYPTETLPFVRRKKKNSVKQIKCVC